tara:strand:- start:1133 stop:1633 length:501 start_codon:yes stop_codon:yes gene_type:complete
MWFVVRFNKRNEEILKKSLREKFGIKVKFYSPKILIQQKIKNLFVKKEKNILGDYLFCYHESFSTENIFYTLKFLRGVKDILLGSKFSQQEILKFIKVCKNHEDKNGYMNFSFFNLIHNKKYKFLSGPFAEKIFTLIEENKNKINILIGNLKTSVNKKDFLFSTTH